jgi:hypothetical protein
MKDKIVKTLLEVTVFLLTMHRRKLSYFNYFFVIVYSRDGLMGCFYLFMVTVVNPFFTQYKLNIEDKL